MTGNVPSLKFLSTLLFSSLCVFTLSAQPLTTGGVPARLDIQEAGTNSIRISLSPLDQERDYSLNPVLAKRDYPAPIISLTEINGTVNGKLGNLTVEIKPNPLTIIVTNNKGEAIQEIVFRKDGNMTFNLDGQPVLGMGEGGPKPEDDWRNMPVEFDRLGRLHKMQPRWQADAYGSRNPVALMIGTGGWALYVATPWGQVDLRNGDHGIFIPVELSEQDSMQQTQKNQGLNLGKGIPPMDKIVPGYYDIFVFDAHDPVQFMKDVSLISGPAVLPPKWSLGYMQSHRTLEDDVQMVEIVETFRAKQIPIDAVIYLGTGFCPRGWNTKQPSFDFNPELFKRDPEKVFADLHEKNVKVLVHMVPWDRDRLPTLHGNLPSEPDETLDESHISNYWKQHLGLVNSGVDAWWPDEGDWFNLFERMKRHQLYYQGPLSTQPNTRPWSLHRNGHLGIAQWGGWVWSGDTESAWKTLEAQVAVGINHSLSLSPFWGSDIGGFYPNEELTGELYARWFQFGAFCPSFRSHGRTWWTRLPWGWGLSEMGPLEARVNPLESELNNPAIEPVCKQYAELRYNLLSYAYTLSWEARNTGMPMMRAMWLHYPEDENVMSMGDQYLWGRNILVAPVYTKGATSRKVYLPEGVWYDWWTDKKENGGQHVRKEVDLSIMPIYVREGSIIPIDPVKQYTTQEVNEPMTIRIYSGSNGEFTLYEDDGITLDYLKGDQVLTHMSWDDNAKLLTIEPENSGSYSGGTKMRIFRVELLPEGDIKTVNYKGKTQIVKF
jgi:alpha-glucosidase (family GH31 glycosyl hydrolase)